jgi:hypothetical protein
VLSHGTESRAKGVDMGKRLCVLVATAIGVVAIASVAHAGSEAALTLNPTSGPPGTEVTGTTTCDPDSGEFTLVDPDGNQFGETTSFTGTQFTATFPPTAVAGTWMVNLSCTIRGSQVFDADPFEVTAAQPPPPAPEPPTPEPPAAAVPAAAQPRFTG